METFVKSIIICSAVFVGLILVLEIGWGLIRIVAGIMQVCNG